MCEWKNKDSCPVGTVVEFYCPEGEHLKIRPGIMNDKGRCFGIHRGSPTRYIWPSHWRRIKPPK